MLNHPQAISSVPLTHLKKGQKAKIVELPATKQVGHRLSSLGLRLGATIVKISSFALKGPVTVKVGSTTIALGHSMAEKVHVELLHKTS